MTRTCSTGADLLLACLEQNGVECVFGVAGTQLIPLLESLPHGRIRYVGASSELSASFMANGYFRSSGKVPVLLTIPGPGFMTALTGVAEAQADSAALIFISIRVDASHGAYPLQKVDQRGIVSSLVKGVLEVSSLEAIESTIETAIQLATEGEPGPVFIEIVPAVLLAPTSIEIRDEESSSHLLLSPPADTLRAIKDRIAGADKVVLFVGAGSVDAAAEIGALAEQLDAPVLFTTSGRGILPDEHRLTFLFDFSFGGGSAVRNLFAEADLILVLGAKLTHNGTGGYSLGMVPEKTLRIDSSPEVLETSPGGMAVFVANIPAILTELLRDGVPAKSPWTEGARKRFEESRARDYEEHEVRFPYVGDAPAVRVLERLREWMPDNGIVTTDSGLHQYVVRRGFPLRWPRGLLVPSDFQSMGYGIPSAIGAAVACPSRRTVAVVGDGGFLMSGLELASAVRESISVIVMVFADNRYGLIALQQEERSGERFGSDVSTPALPHFSEAIGAHYFRYEGVPDFFARIPHSGVVIIEVPVKENPGQERVRQRALLKERARNLVPASVQRIIRRIRGKG